MKQYLKKNIIHNLTDSAGIIILIEKQIETVLNMTMSVFFKQLKV
jgi:hypothetical protein